MRHSVSIFALMAGMVAATIGSGAIASTPVKKAPVAAEKAKPEAKSYKFSGGLQVGVSSDRNAGDAPLGDGMKGSNFVDEDEEEDEEDTSADFSSDAVEDLDLDDQDAIDQENETNDEDGDGDFFDDDTSFDPGEPVAADLNGDGIDDDFNGDGTLDDANGDGLDDPGQDPLDPAGADAGAGVDPLAIVEQARAVPNPASKNIVSDERLATRAKLGFSKKLHGWAQEWKAAAQVATASFDTLSKNDNVMFVFNTGPVFNVKKWKARIQPSLVVANLRKDGKEQFNNYGGIIDAQFALTKMWALDLRYGYDVRSFQDDKIDNITAHSPSVGLSYKLAKNQAILLAARTRFEDTDVLARAKDQYQFTVGYKQKWHNGWYVVPQVGYAFIQRGAAVNAKQARRQDNRTIFNLAVGRDFGYGINVEAQYGQMDVNSNLIGKDSSNDRFVLLTGWKF